VSQEVKDGVSFLIEPKGQLFISKDVVNTLNNYRQSKPGNTEAGGILLGRQYEYKPDITVDEITTPLTTDTRSRYSFYRSIGHHNVAVNRWKQSDGCCLYLGLWHTHPEAIPIPSSVDFDDWTKAINNGVFEGDNLFFVIVGMEQLCCWQGTRTPIYKRVIRRKIDFKQLRFAHE